MVNSKRRYKSLFTLSVHLALVFIALAYATIYSGVLNYFSMLQQINNIASMLGIFNYIFFTLPLVLLFIPFQKPKIIFFQKTDPVRFNKRTTLEITNQLCSSFFLLQITAISILFFYARAVSVLQAIGWIELLILAAIARLIIQALIHLKNRHLAIATLLIILAGAFAAYQHLTLSIATLVLIAAAITLYHLLQYAYRQ